MNAVTAENVDLALLAIHADTTWETLDNAGATRALAYSQQKSSLSSILNEAHGVPRSKTAEKKQQLWNLFKSRSSMKGLRGWKPRKPGAPDYDYTPDLLCHARLYVFSDRDDCDILAKMALQKLRLTLSRFDACEDVSAAIELMRYSYAHTMEYKHDCDLLRELVMDYTVCHLEDVVKEKEFRELMKQEGAFADDLVTRLVARLE